MRVYGSTYILDIREREELTEDVNALVSEDLFDEGLESLGLLTFSQNQVLLNVLIFRHLKIDYKCFNYNSQSAFRKIYSFKIIIWNSFQWMRSMSRA